MIQCSRFSMCQWARTAVAKRLAESVCGREEVAPFDRGFSVAPDLSLNPGHHSEVLKAPLAGEAPVAFQPVDFVAHGVPSDCDTAMTAVEGVVVRAGIGLGVCEEALDFGARNRPVVLESEQIVRSLVADCLGDFGLTPHGVDGDERADLPAAGRPVPGAPAGRGGRGSRWIAPRRLADRAQRAGARPRQRPGATGSGPEPCHGCAAKSYRRWRPCRQRPRAARLPTP